MAETINIRQERIKRLLEELRYELERGMMEREIGEEMTYQFFVPLSSKLPDGVVMCRFETRPVHRSYAIGFEQSKLRIIK